MSYGAPIVNVCGSPPLRKKQIQFAKHSQRLRYCKGCVNLRCQPDRQDHIFYREPTKETKACATIRYHPPQIPPPQTQTTRLLLILILSM
jgi:hypothetical protein